MKKNPSNQKRLFEWIEGFLFSFTDFQTCLLSQRTRLEGMWKQCGVSFKSKWEE